MSWKVSESDYQNIEDNVILYPFYKKELKRLTEDILFATPERDDNGGGRSNIPGRPTENTAIKLADIPLSNNQIARMVRYVDAIETTFPLLEEEKQRFIQMLYWNDKKTVSYICQEFSISAATSLRWKKAFLLQIGILTGDKR